MNLSVFIEAAKAAAPLLSGVPQLVAVFNAAKVALSDGDQATAAVALQDAMADNDAGHARLQAKLDAASKR